MIGDGMPMFVPIEAPGYSMTDWQKEDLEAHLAKLPEEVDYFADWSEMGCYKTTSGIWLAERVTEAFGTTSFAPRLMFITSRNGKGTYYDAVPKTLEKKGYRFFDVGIGGVRERVGLDGIILNKWEISEWYDMLNSESFTDKSVILSHYHCYTNKSPVRQWLQRLAYSFIVVDEAHRIKNKDAQWTRHIKKLAAVCGRHVMTGTGFVNSPDEIWSLLNFLNEQRWAAYGMFRRYFCDEVDLGDYKQVIGVKRETRDEFRALVRDIGQRREMSEVHKDIQEPIFASRDVDLNPTQRAMYDQLRLELYTLDQKGVPLNAPNVLSLLNRLRQVCVATPQVVSDEYDPVADRRKIGVQLVEPSSKLDEVMDLLQELRWDDEKKQQVVVFSQFKDPLYLLEKRLEAKKIPYLHMEAKHTDEERYRLWHDVFPEKAHQVFLSTLDLGGESINLTPAEYCIFLDRSWSPRANNQAVGRVYRPGQTKAVEIIHINARSTVDQRMIATHERKTGWFKEIFGDEPPPDDDFSNAPKFNAGPPLQLNRFYETTEGEVIKCGDCWTVDIGKTLAGEYSAAEAVLPTHLTLLSDDDPLQCDDCLKQNAAYEQVGEDE